MSWPNALYLYRVDENEMQDLKRHLVTLDHTQKYGDVAALSWTGHIHQRWIVLVQSGTKRIFTPLKATNDCFLIAYILIPCALVVVPLDLRWSSHAAFGIVNAGLLTISIDMAK